jgi:hypothetical protein
MGTTNWNTRHIDACYQVMSTDSSITEQEYCYTKPASGTGSYTNDEILLYLIPITTSRLRLLFGPDRSNKSYYSSVTVPLNNDKPELDENASQQTQSIPGSVTNDFSKASTKCHLNSRNYELANYKTRRAVGFDLQWPSIRSNWRGHFAPLSPLRGRKKQLLTEHCHRAVSRERRAFHADMTDIWNYWQQEWEFRREELTLLSPSRPFAFTWPVLKWRRRKLWKKGERNPAAASLLRHALSSENHSHR